MPRKSNVVTLFEAARTKREARERQITGWEDTPQRKLTRERNWCRYLLAGFEVLTDKFMKRFMSKHTYEAWMRAITSARYAIDAGYYDKLDRLNNRGRK